MSSENLRTSSDDSFIWQDDSAGGDYTRVKYCIEAVVEPLVASVALAREQSAISTRISSRTRPIQDFTARVGRIESSHVVPHEGVAEAFFLNTASYPKMGRKRLPIHCFEVGIHFPGCIFDGDLTALWSTIGGEIHRLGFVTCVKIMEVEYSPAFLKEQNGPRVGVRGVREWLNVPGRPILCRSARPAVGLDVKSLVEMAREVLLGGFDLVKDDELTFDTNFCPFEERVNRMMEMVAEVEQKTGEKKGYLCNLTGSPRRTFELAKVAKNAGCTGFLLCPAIQGIGILQDLAQEFRLPILAHNAWQDAISRPRRFGVSEEVLIGLNRLAGADLVMMPGAFSTGFMEAKTEIACVRAALGPTGFRRAFPILAGGKRPEEARKYFESIGSRDFMLIVATAVDEHQDGIEKGAAMFRQAIEEI